MPPTLLSTRQDAEIAKIRTSLYLQRLENEFRRGTFRMIWLRGSR